MSHTSIILSGLFLMAMLLFFAPGIFAMNQGRVLRNIALWLAIFLGLALIYRAVGPGSPYPLFQLPESMSGMEKEKTAPPTEKPPTDKETGKEPSDAGKQGFTPPKE